MRKVICLLLLTTALPLMAATTAPADSEMVYRSNLGRADDIELLLTQGGNLNAVDNNGVGLLFLAAGRKDPEGINVVHVLLSHGLDINSRDPMGRTPLFHAAKAGNGELVQYLLDNGADPYITDNDGDVARNVAYRAGNLDVVELMDNFARKKVEEVNSAYERINRILEERYKQLQEQQRKAAQPAPAAPSKPSANAKPATDTKAAADIKAKGDTAPASESAAAAQPPSGTQDTAQPAEAPAAAPNATDAAQSPEQVYAKAIVSSISQTMDEMKKKKDLEAKIAEEERASKVEQAKQEALQAQLAEEAKKEEQEQKTEEARKAAEALQKSLYDARMEAYMRAEIEAEAAAIKIQQQKEELEDPVKRKARLAKEQEHNKELDNIFHELAYNNCMFQYWYYCYTADMTTELDSQELRDIIEKSKNNIGDLQDTLLNDYKVDVNKIRTVSHSAKKRIFSQLDLMHSSRQRRSEGVGNVIDGESRCTDIALHWDVLPGSVITERKREKEDDKASPAVSFTPSPQQNQRPAPYTGRAGRRR